MAVICNTCGLPEDLCACDELAKDSTKIIIRLETRRFKKKGTMIEGLDPKLNSLEAVAKELKNKYACGGTAKEGYIFLQGEPQRHHKGHPDRAGLSKGDHKNYTRQIEDLWQDIPSPRDSLYCNALGNSRVAAGILSHRNLCSL